jgi:hypothetical protein
MRVARMGYGQRVTKRGAFETIVVAWALKRKLPNPTKRQV